MILLDFASTVLLTISIKRFRKISNNNTGLQESKLAIFMHLTLFSIETFLIIAFLVFQFAYVKTGDLYLFNIASWCHVCA